MADITLYGHIEGIRYTENNVIVTLTEYANGYRKRNGEVVDETVYSYVIGFKTYFKAYIASHFAKGMLVKIKGTMLPFSASSDNGYTINGQTIDLASRPKSFAAQERKMVRESQEQDIEIPNINEYNKPDF